MAIFAFAIGNSGEGIRPGGAAILTKWRDRPGNYYNPSIPYVIAPSGLDSVHYQKLNEKFKASGFWLPPT